MLVAVRKGQDIQAALLTVIEQQVGIACSGEISIEFLVIGARWQAKREATGGK